METSIGSLRFRRYPNDSIGNLQATDASDELVLEQVNSGSIKNILIIEDRFGAITLGLMQAGYGVEFLSDSFVSHQGLRENALLNNMALPVMYNDISGIEDFLKFDLVIFKDVKNLDYFEDIIQSIYQKCRPDCEVIVPAMIKHLSKTTFTILEKYFQKVWTSLAKKKARLLFASSKKEKVIFKEFKNTLKIPELVNPVTNFSNVFSRQSLDIGTRFFIENLPPGKKKVLDLGCGNGIVGLTYKAKNPDSEIVFCDESWMAIRSANENYNSWFKCEIKSVWNNCFENQKDYQGQFDLVLCNPPFHQHFIVGDFIARQMFRDAKFVLKEGGKLLVIGNRHLNYHVILNGIFRQVEVVKNNAKFVIIECIK